MRDHHFQLLSNRNFNRWRERHQVMFECGSWEEGEFSPEEMGATRKREIRLIIPKPYSRRSQYNSTTQTFYFPTQVLMDYSIFIYFSLLFYVF